MEMKTDSLYIVSAEENLEDCVLLEKKAQWIQTRQNDCRDDFSVDAKESFFPHTCYLSKEEFSVLK